MPDQVELITTLAWGLGLSLILGYLVSLIRMPALVGYLLAGVCIAPTTPGIVGNLELASQLSEVGVILLMFGVGLHFSLRDLLQVKSVAVPGAVMQMGATTLIGTAMAYFVWDWNFVGSFVLGVAFVVFSRKGHMDFPMEKPVASSEPERVIQAFELSTKNGIKKLHTYMSKDSVQILMGRPDATDVRAVYSTVYEVWKYKGRNMLMDEFTLKFENGELMSVDQYVE